MNFFSFFTSAYRFFVRMFFPKRAKENPNTKSATSSTKLEKSVKQSLTPAVIPLQFGTLTSPHRQARNFLCKQLDITMKQLRKRRVLRDYIYRNGVYSKAEVV